MDLRETQLALRDVQFRDWEFEAVQEGEHVFLRVAFVAVDHNSWREKRHVGRKWRLSLHMTKSEVVQTALKAVLTAIEHEAREEFLYRGAAVFGPHIDVDALVGVYDRQDVRAPTGTTEAVAHAALHA